MSNVSSVFWQVYINNVEVSFESKRCINSIEFSELCDGSDTCTLTIIDPNMVFIQDNLFIEDASIYIRHGFNEDNNRFEFKGYISAIDIHFPEDGSPVLTITCLDKSHLMNRKKKERSWDNVTRPDVVKKIAAEYGFSCKVEPNYTFATESTISQSKQTDIEFIESLAKQEREPFMCKLVGNTIVYLKKGLLQTPVTTVNYRTGVCDVISFSPQITKETKQESVTSANVNTSDKTLESYTATDGNVSRDVQGDSVKTTETSALNETSGSTSTNMVYDPVSRTWIKK